MHGPLPQRPGAGGPQSLRGCPVVKPAGPKCSELPVSGFLKQALIVVD